MQCETCHKETPESEIEEVELNGHLLKIKQCRKCREETQRKLDEYPKQ